MFSDFTLQEYYKFIADLTLVEIILYYFFSYLFLTVLRKALTVDIDTNIFNFGHLKLDGWQRKTLLFLSLIYIFKYFLSWINTFFNYVGIISFEKDIFALVLLLFIVSIFFVRVFVEKGVKYFYQLLFVKKAKERIKKRGQKSKNWDVTINKERIKVDGLNYFNTGKEDWYNLGSVSLVSGILIIYSFSFSYLLGFIILITSSIVLIDYLEKLKKRIKQINKLQHTEHVLKIKK